MLSGVSLQVSEIKKSGELNKYNKSLPRTIGQILLIHGIKKVTKEEMIKRFAIESVNKRLIEEGKQRCFDKIQATELELTMNNYIVLSKNVVYSDPNTIVDKTLSKRLKRKLIKNRGDGNVYGELRYKKSNIHMEDVIEFEEEVYTAEVTEIKLDEYSEDIIPDRVLESVETAKKLGCDNFTVYYPQILSREQRRLKDPIIVCKHGRNLFEIDWWD